MGWGIVETKDENVVGTVEVVTSEYADDMVSSNWAGTDAGEVNLCWRIVTEH
jgi:hypothetical protein